MANNNRNNWNFKLVAIFPIILSILFIYALMQIHSQDVRYSVLDSIAGYETSVLPYEIEREMCFENGQWCDDLKHDPYRIRADYTVVDWQEETITFVYWTRWYCFALKYDGDFNLDSIGNPHPIGAWFVTC